jgi:hypothetical protein
MDGNAGLTARADPANSIEANMKEIGFFMSSDTG